MWSNLLWVLAVCQVSAFTPDKTNSTLNPNLFKNVVEKSVKAFDPLKILIYKSVIERKIIQKSRESIVILPPTFIKKVIDDIVRNESKPEEKETIPNVIFDNSHWITVSNFSVGSNLPVVKYISNLTGLTVILAQAESPIVNGYFCLATEAQDNDGLPHTLEHLIFRGSEDYPYKEVLDLLASRCLAHRTNAWTAIDHTCYTVYTAGSSGFLNILPVFMDHILHPTLREQDFITEIHHINGKGEDAGVVYSEMQGRQNTPFDLIGYKLLQKLYPNSGYHKVTGGKMGNLRKSTSLTKIREYHRKFYRTENLVLTITGKFDEQEVFERLRKTEEKVLQKQYAQGITEFVQPWQSPLQKVILEEDDVNEVEYPNDDETTSKHVVVGWRLPMFINENIELFEAYDILLEYLKDTQVSPFKMEFVETEDPLATSIYSWIGKFKEPYISLWFNDVPIDKVDQVVPKMEKLFTKIVNDGPENIDMERISNIIDNKMLTNLKNIENYPDSFLVTANVLDMLYGENAEQYKKFVTSTQSINQYKDKNGTFWINLMEEIFMNNGKVVVKGKPSKDKAKQITEEEKQRVKQQVENLGPEGLKEKEELVENAVKSARLPGFDVLNKVPMADVNKIQFRPFESYNRTQNSNNLLDFNDIPFKIQVEDIHSNFVYFSIYLDTQSLTVRQKKLLPLLSSLLGSTPIKKDGAITDLEEIMKIKEKSVLNIGFYQSNQGDAFVIGGSTERIKFGDAVNYLSDVINYVHLTPLKVNTTAAKLLNGIPSQLTSAGSVLYYLHGELFFSNDSSMYHWNILRQKVLLEEVLEDIKTNPQSIIEELYGLIRTLVKPENAFLHLATNAKELIKIYGPGLQVLKSIFNNSVEIDQATLSEHFTIKSDIENRNFKPNTRHVIFGLESTDSCYMRQSIFYNNTDWTDPEVADILIMLQYLEERMHHEVRGKGLTYGVYMGLSMTEGMLSLSLYRSSKLPEAYKIIRDIFKKYIESENEWDETLAESARGSVIYSYTSSEESVSGLVNQALWSYLRGTDSKFNRNFVRVLGKVKLAGMIAAAKKILPVFLSEDSTMTAVVCNPRSIDEAIKQFNDLGIELTKYESLEDFFLPK